jgi:predicted nucleotidyltransferase
MGRKVAPGRRTSAEPQQGIADALFSKARRRVLGVLYGNPGRSFYASEVIALAGSGTGAVQRELARLAAAGLITARLVGRQKHYQANPSAPVYEELRGLVLKTSGLADVLRSSLAGLALRVRAAFVFGSIAKGQDVATSDIDLLVISDDLTYPDLFSALEEAGVRLGRRVNPTILSLEELATRQKQGNAFVSRVLSQPKLWVLGNEHELPS